MSDSAGSFVVEIGYRQFPFLGFCDNRPTPSWEARLYIDTTWSISGVQTVSGGVDGTREGVCSALAHRRFPAAGQT